MRLKCEKLQRFCWSLVLAYTNYMEKKRLGKPKYMLVDGNALIHRGYHAIPGLTVSKTGEPVGAVYGFTMILLRAIKDLKPTHIACCFDLDGPTFRHEEYADYKATRVKADQELYDQIPRVKEVVRVLNIPIFEKQGFEADDVLGTLAKEICATNDNACEVMIVTGDMDTLQLVNSCVKVYTLRKGLTDVAIYDEKAVRARFELNPSQMIDYKALRGDPSDNIKGVKGIGEKGAVDLLKKFGSLEQLYIGIKNNELRIKNEIKPRVLQLLKDQEKEARQSYKLATIVLDVPLEVNIPPYRFGVAELNMALPLFQELEFRSLLEKLPKNYTAGEVLPEKEIDTSRPLHVTEHGLTTKEKIVQDYHLVDNQERLKPLLKELKTCKLLALDTETTSLDAVSAELLGVALATETGKAYYVTSGVLGESLELKHVLESGLDKLGQNIKYDALVLENFGVRLGGVWHDTMLMSYLLNPGTRQHNLDAMAFNELGYQMQPIEELIGKGKNQINMSEVPVEKVSWYASEDVDMTLRLYEIFLPRLQKEGLESVYKNIELPLIPVLAGMERVGIKLNAELLNKLAGEAEIEIKGLEKKIYKLAGEEFNINSPKQLKVVLFEKLGLSSDGNKKTKTGLSTAAGELEKMLGEHPVVEAVLQYRELSKLLSTYLLALPELVNQNTGRIHTSYNQTIAATGRLSSTEPNLQNIPVKGEGLGSQVRQAFVAEKGYKLLSIDYSQMELRIVAHLSSDSTMTKVFQEGDDIHTSTAMGLFGVTADKVTKDMRRDAKTINFGILYGLSSFGLSYRIAELSRAEARDYIDKYFERYPGVKEYIEKVKMQVNQDGLVKNELGRIRRFPEIKSSQYFIRQAAERAAINFPIQSLQADIIKMAMKNIWKEISKQQTVNNSKQVADQAAPTLYAKPYTLNPECRMLLQVHDELVFEVEEDKVEQYLKLIKPMMENAYKLSVPVTCEAKVGDNWGEMVSI